MLFLLQGRDYSNQPVDFHAFISLRYLVDTPYYKFIILRRKVNANLLRLDFSLGKLNDRLDMFGSGEHVHRLGLGGGQARFGEHLHVPGQGGGVAGDIHHAVRGHPDDGLDDSRIQPPPGWILHDHVRPGIPGGKPGGDLPGVAAEKLHILT